MALATDIAKKETRKTIGEMFVGVPKDDADTNTTAKKYVVSSISDSDFEDVVAESDNGKADSSEQLDMQEALKIVIPAYNEEVRIHSSIQETLRTVDGFGCDYEVIVVEDGSKDRTYEEIMKAARGADVIINLA